MKFGEKMVFFDGFGGDISGRSRRIVIFPSAVIPSKEGISHFKLVNLIDAFFGFSCGGWRFLPAQE
ncbi:MAG: hypothetical protein ACI9O6_003129 [Glaciecola sp.]|jgi:hypothetical protein